MARDPNEAVEVILSQHNLCKTSQSCHRTLPLRIKLFFGEHRDCQSPEDLVVQFVPPTHLKVPVPRNKDPYGLCLGLRVPMGSQTPAS